MTNVINYIPTMEDNIPDDTEVLGVNGMTSPDEGITAFEGKYITIGMTNIASAGLGLWDTVGRKVCYDDSRIPEKYDSYVALRAYWAFCWYLSHLSDDIPF